MDRDGFRTRIKEYLRDVEKSQEQLAFQIGLDPATLSNKLSGRRGTLTVRETKEIVLALVQWHAITTDRQLRDLLDMTESGSHLFTVAEQSVAPLAALHRAVPPAPSDMDGAQIVPYFYGRTAELAQMQTWIVQQRCQMVVVLGTGGIGKTALAVRAAEAVEGSFTRRIWCSLRDAPPLDTILDTCLVGLGESPPTASRTTDTKLQALLQALKRQRALLVLDNVEAIVAQDGEQSAYSTFFARLCDTPLQSCVMLTSREMPSELVMAAAEQTRVCALTLHGLDIPTGQQLLTRARVAGSPAAVHQLVDLYGGNPLLLKIIAGHIRNLFETNVDRFLESGVFVFGDITRLLTGQFARLSSLEKQIICWLAIVRAPVPLAHLLHMVQPAVPKEAVFEALDRLQRCSLLEISRNSPGFTLQPVVMEYGVQYIVQHMADEIAEAQPHLLIAVALQPPASQRMVELIVARLLLRLRTTAAGTAALQRCAEVVQSYPPLQQGYGSANLAAIEQTLAAGTG